MDIACAGASCTALARPQAQPTRQYITAIMWRPHPSQSKVRPPPLLHSPSRPSSTAALAVMRLFRWVLAAPSTVRYREPMLLKEAATSWPTAPAGEQQQWYWCWWWQCLLVCCSHGEALCTSYACFCCLAVSEAMQSCTGVSNTALLKHNRGTAWPVALPNSGRQMC